MRGQPPGVAKGIHPRFIYCIGEVHRVAGRPAPCRGRNSVQPLLDASTNIVPWEAACTGWVLYTRCRPCVCGVAGPAWMVRGHECCPYRGWVADTRNCEQCG